MTDTVEQQVAQLRSVTAAQQEELNELRQWIAGHSDGSEQIPHKFQMSERVVIGNAYHGTYPLTFTTAPNAWRLVRLEGLQHGAPLPVISEPGGWESANYVFERIGANSGGTSTFWEMIVAQEGSARHMTYGADADSDEVFLHIEGEVFFATASPAQITANQNNYNPTDNGYNVIFRLSSDAARTITGWVPGRDVGEPDGHFDHGRFIMVLNVGSFNITFADESASSTEANRFALPQDLMLGPDMGATFVYDETSSRWRLVSHTSTGLTGVFGITIDGSGNILTTGEKGYTRLPFSGTITKWTLIADQTGSIEMDIWKDTFANHPPFVSDSIVGSAPPLLSTDNEAESTTLTGWTTTITAGDVVGFYIASVTSINRIHLLVEYTKA